MTDSVFDLGNDLVQKGDYGSAVDVYLNLVDDDLGNEQLQVNLGYACLRAGRSREGIDELEKFLEREGLPAVSFEFCVNLALLYNASGETDSAFTLLGEARKRDHAREEFYIALAAVQTGIRAYDDAMETYLEAQAECSESANLHNHIGSFYNDVVGDHNLAVVHFAKALSIAPNDPAIHNNLGIARVALGNYSKAIESLSRSIEIDDEYFSAYHNLAVALFNSGEYAKAAEVLDDGLRKFPDYAASHNFTEMRDEARELAEGH